MMMLNLQFLRSQTTIPQYSYSDLLKKIQATGATSQWGDDLYPVQLKQKLE